MSCTCHEKGRAAMKSAKKKLRVELACTFWHHRDKRAQNLQGTALSPTADLTPHITSPSGGQTFFCCILQMYIKITAISFLPAGCMSWPKLRPDLSCPCYDWYQVGIRPIIMEYFADNEALQSQYYYFQHMEGRGRKVAQAAHCSLHPTVWLCCVLALSQRR